MERLKIRRPLSSLGGQSTQAQFRNIGVPTAARMVHDAGMIAVGYVQGIEQPMFYTEHVLKGQAVGSRPLTLANPTEGRSLAFNLRSVAALIGEQPTVILGRPDLKDSVLWLTWLDASIWPQGYQHDTFDGGSLQQALEFIKNVLAFSQIASRDPDATIRLLVDDIKSGRTQPALAYLEIAVEDDFLKEQAANVRAVAALAMDSVVLDLPSLRQFADTLFLWPATIAFPMGIRALDQIQGEDAERIREALYAELSARGVSLDPNATSAELRAAFATIAPTLRWAEGRRFTKIFDSPLPILRDTSSNELLMTILHERPRVDLTRLSAPERKAAWEKVISSLRD